MPTFHTPDPISVTIDLVAGNTRVTASERQDTVVEVLPSDASDESDVHAAEHTRVEHAGETLLVKGPKRRGLFSRTSQSVQVNIELPAGSQVSGDVSAGDLWSTGRLGTTRFKTGVGLVQLDRTGPLQVATGAGNVTVDGVSGHAEITTGSGKVRCGELGGTAVLKNSNGATEIGTVTGDLKVRSANGDISIDLAAAGVEAKTSNGNLRLGAAVRGSVSLETSLGDLDIGIRDGSTAWLDVKTDYGRMHQDLDDATHESAPSGDVVELYGRTSFGAITVRRS